jgi:phospholipid/cholesterol/gamma-HCH transport system substrate-binding protein
VKFSKELKAGVIALLAIVGFVVLFQFMKGRSLFTTDNIFYAKYDNVEGLAQSSPVSINGLKVGQVVKIIPKQRKQDKLTLLLKLLLIIILNFQKILH